jgi:hypothetical protein
VFNTGALPVNGLNVTAYKKNNTVVVAWESKAENNVKVYAVEKSSTGTDFKKLTEATAKNDNATNTYSITDNNPVNGINYYRIKTTSNNSKENYSAIVRVEMSDKVIKGITVYPNPVAGNVIGLQLNNIASGNYTARLFNSVGQEVYVSNLQHNGNNGSTGLLLTKSLATGTYQLQISDNKGNNYQQTVVVVE